MASQFVLSSLWSRYSMLKSTIIAYDNVNISSYPRFLGFLKKHNSGYRPKKSKVLTTADVSKFLKEAPDAQYLVTKVCMYMCIHLYFLHILYNNVFAIHLRILYGHLFYRRY